MQQLLHQMFPSHGPDSRKAHLQEEPTESKGADELILLCYFIASEDDTAVKCPSPIDERFCGNGTSGALTRSGGKRQGEGKVQVLKLLESPKMLQNVEVSAMEQILISSLPLLKINTCHLGGICVLAGIMSWFVSVPIPPYRSLAPPLPVILDTLEFCIIFFF